MERLNEFHETKKELSHAQKDLAELTEVNKKLEIELENQQQIDTAIEYLRQSNQKVTTRNAELETEIALKETQALELEQQAKLHETQNKMLKDQVQELQVEIDRIRYQSNDLNNSVMNMSAISVNQQMVSDMENRIQRLESENEILKASKSDKVRVQLLEKDQCLQEKSLEVDRLTTLNTRLEK